MNDNELILNNVKNIKFKKISEKDIKKCSDLLATSFLKYRYFATHFTSEKKCKKFLDNLMNLELKININRGEMYACIDDDEIIGVIMMFRQMYKRPSILKYIIYGLWKNVFYGTLGGVISWACMESKASALCHKLNKEAWYLSAIAVKNNRQGQGVGFNMINNFIIPYIKENGGNKLCLFTNSEVNKKFYESNGFEVCHEQFLKHKNETIGNWICIKDIN